MYFKPTILKTIVSLLVAIIIDYFLNSNFICSVGDKCPTTLQLMISTTGIMESLVSFIIVYIIWSLIQKKK